MSKNNAEQVLLSENLLLLKEFGGTYPKPDSQSFPKSVRDELRVLDAVASVLTSGNSDSFAATLNKSKGFIEVILAKSPGRPTMEDKEFAKEFSAVIIDLNTRNVTDVFPFLSKHRRDYLNMRIKKLHAISTDDEFNKYFHEYLGDRYVTEDTDPSLAVQFPWGGSRLDQDKNYVSLLKDCLIQTQRLSESDLEESFSDAHKTFHKLYRISRTLASSAFMQWTKDGHGVSFIEKKVEKFIRHAEKLGRFIRDIWHILWFAKRRFASGSEIPHRWVEDTFIGTGEGNVQLLARNAHKAVGRVRGTSPLPDKHSANLDKVLSPNREPWQPLFAHHPEIRIILSSLVPEERYEMMRPIGLSKQPCFGCTVWIERYNRDRWAHWVTGGFWGKADPTFALSGDAYLYKIGEPGQEVNKVDQLVKHDVEMQLSHMLSWVLEKGCCLS